LRGAESAFLTAPYVRTLSIVGLGNGVPTPSAGIEGEVVLCSTLEQLIRMPPETWRPGQPSFISSPRQSSTSAQSDVEYAQDQV
jgi:hypothetical protein